MFENDYIPKAREIIHTSIDDVPDHNNRLFINVQLASITGTVDQIEKLLIDMAALATALVDHSNIDNELSAQRLVIVQLVLLAVAIACVLFVAYYIKRSNMELSNKAHHDGLTGIFNRRYLDESFDRIIKSLSRSKSSLSVLMVDIDFFKKYNDTYGHQAGDKCLKIIAETISTSITRQDDFAARYGGEEFIAILPNTGKDGAHINSKKITGKSNRT